MKPTRMIILLASVSTIAIGCARPVDPTTVRDARTTLRDVGKRLGAAMSPEDLTRVGGTEKGLLRVLTNDERRSFAAGALRFRVDRRVIVDLAVPGDRPPFWLAEMGFRATGRSIAHPDGSFQLWSRRFPAGVIGLGVNALDRRAAGHYAVFVRGETGAPIIDAIDDPGWTIVDARLDSSPYSDDARPFDPLPSDLAGARLLQPRREWRDQYALIRWPVWKTRVPSRAEADQVVVSLGADPRRELAFSWRTDMTVATSQLRIERLDGSDRRLVEGKVTPITSDGLLNDPVVARHRVNVTGLAPDAEYRYSIRGGSGWTAPKTVRTAPAGDRDYAFLYMGDPQCGLEEWGKLLHVARQRRPDAGFLLIAGDLVDRGNERGNWDHFFLRAEGVFDNLPLMPAVGNHEYLDKGPEIFARTFVLPENGPDVPRRLSYCFEYSDTFVAVVDSNPAVYSIETATKIGDWLDDQLARTKARWKVVMFHHPVYPSHPTREQPQLARAWEPIFDRRGVDLVLQGHDHAYLRTHPMRGGRPATGGTTYVVSVSGQKFVPVAKRDYAEASFADVATYQTIDVSPTRGTLLYRAIDLEGVERDRLELQKPVEKGMAARPSIDAAVRRSAAP